MQKDVFLGRQTTSFFDECSALQRPALPCVRARWLLGAELGEHRCTALGLARLKLRKSKKAERQQIRWYEFPTLEYLSLNASKAHRSALLLPKFGTEKVKPMWRAFLRRMEILEWGSVRRARAKIQQRPC